MRLFSFINKPDKRVPYEPKELGRSTGLHFAINAEAQTMRLQFRSEADADTHIVVELNRDESDSLRAFLGRLNN